MSASGITELDQGAIAQVFVTDNAMLNRLCARWATQDHLALDTEFIRTSTFYPKAGLVQVSDGDANYLLDPLAIDDWKAFRALMTQPDLTKIFHSCGEDLLVFHAFLGVIPEPLFDTQVAAAYLGKGLSLSYQNLVREMIGVDLPKGETRSDWLQRPLTTEQLLYAALDVVYLPEIWRRQREELLREDKMSWFEEDCERLIRLFDDEVAHDFADAYLDIKGAWQLGRRSLAALQRLAEWRELRARRRDRPRNWIVKDLQLLAIARAMPRDRQQLQTVPDLGPNFLKYEGDAVLKLIADARALPDDALPAPLPRPLVGEQKDRLKEAQRFVQEKADTLGLSSDLLARKRVLLGLYHAILELGPEDHGRSLEERLLPGMPEELKGWRRELLMDDLLRILFHD